MADNFQILIAKQRLDKITYDKKEGRKHNTL